MSDQPTPGDGQPGPASSDVTAGPHRIHPAYVVMNAVRTVVSLLAAAVVAALGGVLSDGGVTALVRDRAFPQILTVAVGAVVALFVLAALFSFIYYKRYLWEITESEIHIYSGILFKKQTHIPFRRVQSVDFSATLPQRVLGLVKLKIETAGGAANRNVTIPAMKLSQAEAFRAEVLARKRLSSQPQRLAAPTAGSPVYPSPEVSGAAPVSPAQPPPGLPGARSGADRFISEIGEDSDRFRGLFADDYDDNAPIDCQYRLSAKELFLSAVSNDNNLVLLIVLVSALSQASPIVSLFIPDFTLESAVVYALHTYALPIIIAAVVVIFVVVTLLSIIGTAVQYGGFKATRRGGRVEVEMGLLSRQYKGVSADRIQSVEIHQGAIRRLLGYAELRLLTIDSLDSSQGQQNTQKTTVRGLVIHPYANVRDIDAILHRMVPEYDDREADAPIRRLPRAALRRVVIRHAVIFVVVYAACAAAVTLVATLATHRLADSPVVWLIGLVWALLALFVVTRTIGAVLWYKHGAHAHNARMLTIRQGFFGLTTTIIPKKKIQWAQAQQNPLQRRVGVASITAVTAAGIGGTRTKLRDVSADDAASYLDWVRPTGRC